MESTRLVAEGGKTCVTEANTLSTLSVLPNTLAATDSAIRRSGKKNYWEVRPFLPKETRNYVPNFLAVVYLMEYHAEYGITPKKVLPGYLGIDTVMVEGPLRFDQMAAMMDERVRLSLPLPIGIRLMILPSPAPTTTPSRTRQTITTSSTSTAMRSGRVGEPCQLGRQTPVPGR